MRTRVRATVENRRRIEGFRSMYADDYAGWAAARRALKAMGGMCRERGVPLVVAIFPLFGNPLDDRYPFADVHAKVAQAAAEAGARVVDLLPVYRGLDGSAARGERRRRRAPERDRPPDRRAGDRAGGGRGGAAPGRGRAAPMSRSTSVALVAAAVALQAGLAVHAMRGSSATFDEGAHLPAGYTHLALGDHRLNPEQPPLVKLLAAAPLLAVRPVLKTDARSWAEARQWEFGRSFLYRWNDADRLLFLGRLPIVALASCLVVAVFLEARRRFGDAAAAASLGLAALSPDVLAHGALVTTDLAFALFFFLSVVAFSRVVEEATPRRVVAAGLATGAAFATKFSAPILRAGASCSSASLGAAPAPARRSPSSAVGRAGPARRLGLLRLPPRPVAGPGACAPPSARRSRRRSRACCRARSRPPANAGLVPEDYARGLALRDDALGGAARRSCSASSRTAASRTTSSSRSC